MEMQIFKQKEILDRQINVYGNIENPLFMAKDVAEWLEHSDVSTMIRTIDDDEKILMTNPNNVCGGQSSWFLTENGLYEVFMLSRKPIAKQLKKGIKDMLHSVRIHGAYMTQDTIQKALTDPDFLIRLATELKIEQQKRIEAEETARLQSEQLIQSAPKVQYCDTVLKSVNTYNVNLIAKELGMSAESLNRLLANKGIIYRQGGMWILTSKYQDKGYTKTRTTTYTRSDGSIGTSMLTVWTEKGRQFIHEQFNSSLS